MSAFAMWGVEPRHSTKASRIRSSVELSQRSPNLVQPMPTTATRSAIPRLAILLRSGVHQMGLPEVVVDAARGEQPAKGEGNPGAHPQPLGFGVGDLDGA